MNDLPASPKLNKTSPTSPTGSSHAIHSGKSQEKLPEIPKNSSIKLTPIYEILETVLRDIKNQGLTPKYPTGLRELDDLIWGLHKRELVAIGGYPSNGKSDFMLNLALQLADTHKRIIIFSLEMSKEQILKRILCNLCRIDNVQLRRGLAKQEVEDKKKLITEWTDNMKLLIDDTHGYSLNSLKEVCDIIHPDFIFIDYIQMVETKRNKSKLESIEDYVRDIKQYANVNDVGIVLISQRNKEGDLKWGKILHEHPDTVMLTNWDSVNRKYEVVIYKQRHGDVGKVTLAYKPWFSLFEDYNPN